MTVKKAEDNLGKAIMDWKNALRWELVEKSLEKFIKIAEKKQAKKKGA